MSIPVAAARVLPGATITPPSLPMRATAAAMTPAGTKKGAIQYEIARSLKLVSRSGQTIASAKIARQGAQVRKGEKPA